MLRASTSFCTVTPTCLQLEHGILTKGDYDEVLHGTSNPLLGWQVTFHAALARQSVRIYILVTGWHQSYINETRRALFVQVRYGPTPRCR